jgi:hypothetical protein
VKIRGVEIIMEVARREIEYFRLDGRYSENSHDGDENDARVSVALPLCLSLSPSLSHHSGR